jgi:hypothetical protein
LSIPTNIDEVELIFEKLNRSQDGRFRYSEFSEYMMPVEGKYARMLGQKEFAAVSGLGMKQDTIELYRDIWIKMIQNEKQAENIRHKLA